MEAWSESRVDALAKNTCRNLRNSSSCSMVPFFGSLVDFFAFFSFFDCAPGLPVARPFAAPSSFTTFARTPSPGALVDTLATLEMLELASLAVSPVALGVLVVPEVPEVAEELGVTGVSEVLGVPEVTGVPEVVEEPEVVGVPEVPGAEAAGVLGVAGRLGGDRRAGTRCDGENSTSTVYV